MWKVLQTGRVARGDKARGQGLEDEVKEESLSNSPVVRPRQKVS